MLLEHLIVVLELVDDLLIHDVFLFLLLLSADFFLLHLELCHGGLEVLSDEDGRLLGLLELFLLLFQYFFFLFLCLLQVLLRQLAHLPLKLKLFLDFSDLVVVV